MIERLVLFVVFVIVGVILITGQAVTINTASNTNTGKALENVSATAKTIYGLYDFLWSIFGLVLIVGGLAGIYATAKMSAHGGR